MAVTIAAGLAVAAVVNTRFRSGLPAGTQQRGRIARPLRVITQVEHAN